MRQKFAAWNGCVWGVEPSKYGKENDRLDYRALSLIIGDAIINNEILRKTAEIGFWDVVNGSFDDDDGYPVEVFQWYIISDRGAEILQEYTDEIVMYNDELDMYLWGITHWGTSWDYVLTDIRLSEMEGWNEQAGN